VKVTIQELTDNVRKFCEARDWDQYHGLKDLAIGVITEASELLEHFRFLSDEEAMSLLNNPQQKEEIEDELADVLFFLLRFSQRFDVDLEQALQRKMVKSEKKYLVSKAKGSNWKYTWCRMEGEVILSDIDWNSVGRVSKFWFFRTDQKYSP